MSTTKDQIEAEIKTLQTQLNALQKKAEECCAAERDVRICILQRGWVFVGEFSKVGDQCFLRKASNVRVWGTTKGLGELAEGGPLSGTKLDPVPDVQFHELTLIASVKCRGEKWSK